ncbi:MAG: hypothetical protein KBT06_01325 [Prevotellaceae bacterium]|nr:hypothetical protein [Candidatus Colivivens equi]MCQ2075786.1 hypothetical protein [Bacteroidaceae bacterium]
MKKIIVALVALMMTTGAFAQGFGGGQFNPEDMVKMQVSHINEVCKLDTAQTRKVTEYFTKSQKAMMEAFQNGGGFGQGGDMGDIMKQMQKRQEEQTKFLKETLTEEQFKAYDEDQKKMREQMQQGGFGGFGGGGF